MKDHLSRSEIRKDAVQGTVEAAASTVGQVATIITGAVREVASAVGGFATEVFEIRDSARKAAEEHVEQDAAEGGWVGNACTCRLLRCLTSAGVPGQPVNPRRSKSVRAGESVVGVAGLARPELEHGESCDYAAARRIQTIILHL